MDARVQFVRASGRPAQRPHGRLRSVMGKERRHDPSARVVCAWPAR
jgi:hypothetical protein